MSDDKRLLTADEYCEKFYLWAEVMGVSCVERLQNDTLASSIRTVMLTIEKSCLLKRMVYGGEGLSKTPCPVHKGTWSGIHGPWPESVWVDIMNGSKTPAEPSRQCQKWYDEGCRCFQHKCGCTTGWQPDESCGCVTVEEESK